MSNKCQNMLLIQLIGGQDNRIDHGPARYKKTRSAPPRLSRTACIRCRTHPPPLLLAIPATRQSRKHRKGQKNMLVRYFGGEVTY